MSYDDVIMNRLKQDGIYECVVEMFKAKQAEIERLREALLEIANPANWGVDGYWIDEDSPAEIARAALREKE